MMVWPFLEETKQWIGKKEWVNLSCENEKKVEEG